MCMWRRCAARVALIDRPMRMILDAGRRGAAGMTGMGSGKADEGGNDRAQERQENNRLIHGS